MTRRDAARGSPEAGTAPASVTASGTIGVVMLVHTAFDRAEQVVRHWAGAGCPVVVHVDVAVRRRARDAFAARLSDLPHVLFSPRHRCEWGTWGIVAATLAACEVMLARCPGVGHVFLASGSCLPLRPVAALGAYLAARPRTDFIESATTADVPWTVGGLSEERFTLRFPFSWKGRRRLFDGYVALQRRLRMRRRIPPGIVPHMGSQWWCLTRGTLQAILEDPDRPALDRYFARVWIPDESYFQTLARRHEGRPDGVGGASRIESRSLTLSKFDFQGKPHIFYDDHLQLLRRSDCFVARKIWPHADRLYGAFLVEGAGAQGAEPAPAKIDRVFAKAVERRTRGRPGLWMQSRFPREGWENGVTGAPYSVIEGFAELFEDWGPWLARATGARVHGHLFAPEGAEFAGGGATFAGALSSSATLRDQHAQMFLRNLLWNTRGERQAFQFGPRDSQRVSWDIAKDPNAQVAVVSGAWAVPLFRASQEARAEPAGRRPRVGLGMGLGSGPGSGLGSGLGGAVIDVRAAAARLQRIEADHLGALRSPYAKARIRIWTLAEFVEAPMEALQAVLDGMAQGTGGTSVALGGLAPGGGAVGETAGGLAGGLAGGRAYGSGTAAVAPARGTAGPRPGAPPRLVDLTGFGAFLQGLKNRGMHPYLMGDFPIDPPAAPVADAGPRARRPYLVK